MDNIEHYKSYFEEHGPGSEYTQKLLIMEAKNRENANREYLENLEQYMNYFDALGPGPELNHNNIEDFNFFD